MPCVCFPSSHNVSIVLSFPSFFLFSSHDLLFCSLSFFSFLFFFSLHYSVSAQSHTSFIHKPLTTRYRCYAGEAQCPFCCENLLDSTEVWGVMPGCGHTAHRKCIYEYLQHKTSSIPNCPVCRKTILTKEASEELWAQYRTQVQNMTMPRSYNKEVLITCNDCEKSAPGKLHWLAMECQHCGSFNTHSD